MSCFRIIRETFGIIPKLLKKLAHVLSTLLGSARYRSSNSSKYVLEVPSRKLRAR